MGENELGKLISFVQGLQQPRVSFSLDCVRDAIMVTIPFPDRYLEVEFFADGHIELQSFGPPTSDVVDVPVEGLLEAIVAELNSEHSGPIDLLFKAK